jgi:hypothetical protein
MMARPAGTTFALPAAAKATGLYHASIAIGQITNQCVSEKIAFDFILKRFTELKPIFLG